jgi:hypothetical protein
VATEQGLPPPAPALALVQCAAPVPLAGMTVANHGQTITGNQFRVGEPVHVHCRTGYKIKMAVGSPTNSMMTCQAGNPGEPAIFKPSVTCELLASDEPTCSKQSIHFGTVDSVQVRYPVGTVLNIQCNQDYAPQSPTQTAITCQLGANANSPQFIIPHGAQCIRSTGVPLCNRHESDRRGTTWLPSKTTYGVGDTVTVQCPAGSSSTPAVPGSQMTCNPESSTDGNTIYEFQPKITCAKGQASPLGKPAATVAHAPTNANKVGAHGFVMPSGPSMVQFGPGYCSETPYASILNGNNQGSQSRAACSAVCMADRQCTFFSYDPHIPFVGGASCAKYNGATCHLAWSPSSLTYHYPALPTKPTQDNSCQHTTATVTSLHTAASARAVTIAKPAMAIKNVIWQRVERRTSKCTLHQAHSK